MATVWGAVPTVAPVSLADVMSEQLADHLSGVDRSALYNVAAQFTTTAAAAEDDAAVQTMTTNDSSAAAAAVAAVEEPDVSSDLLLAALLQQQYDRQHDEHVRRQERHHNGLANVRVSFRNFYIDADTALLDADVSATFSTASSSCSDQDYYDVDDDDDDDEEDGAENDCCTDQREHNGTVTPRGAGNAASAAATAGGGGGVRQKRQRRHRPATNTTRPLCDSDENHCWLDVLEDWPVAAGGAMLSRHSGRCGGGGGGAGNGRSMAKHERMCGEPLSPGVCGGGNCCGATAAATRRPPRSLATGHVISALRRQEARAESRARRRRARDKCDSATAGGVLDAAARLTLLSLINGDVLQRVDGVISGGKEAYVLRATGGAASDRLGAAIPAQCAVKVYKTTLASYRTRDKYIRYDRRFDSDCSSGGGGRKRCGRGSTRKLVRLWAEKELCNLRRMARAGIRCPRAVLLKNHVLVMSLVTCSGGSGGGQPMVAPQLRHCCLSGAEWRRVYHQLVDTVRTLYRRCRLVHADLSEYNVLYADGACWLIDVGQSVETRHPLAHQLLYRDCVNVTRFFGARYTAAGGGCGGAVDSAGGAAAAAGGGGGGEGLLTAEAMFTEVSGLALLPGTDLQQQLCTLQRRVTDSYDGVGGGKCDYNFDDRARQLSETEEESTDDEATPSPPSAH